MSLRITWSELCRSDDFSGLWVALDNCRYDQASRQPLEGDLVDADPDLAELCARMREAGRGSCAILLAEEATDFAPLRAWRESMIPEPKAP
jgi:hypothetical protein